MAANKVRIVQRGVVVKASDSPRVKVDAQLHGGLRLQGTDGGQESYPVGIVYVKTGSDHFRERWDAFLASWRTFTDDNGRLSVRGIHVLYGGTDATDWNGRSAVQLIGAEGLDPTTHRSRSRRNQFAYQTAYRLAFSDPAALAALESSGLLARESHFDAPAPLPRGGNTSYPHGRLHPSQRSNQKDAKRCAHVILGHSASTLREVSITQQRIKPDRITRPSVNPYAVWPEGGIAHAMPQWEDGEGI